MLPLNIQPNKMPLSDIYCEKYVINTESQKETQILSILRMIKLSNRLYILNKQTTGLARMSHNVNTIAVLDCGQATNKTKHSRY